MNIGTLNVITFENRNVLPALSVCGVAPEFNIFTIFQFNLIVAIPAKEFIHGVFCKVLKEKQKLLIYIIDNYLKRMHISNPLCTAHFLPASTLFPEGHVHFSTPVQNCNAFKSQGGMSNYDRPSDICNLKIIRKKGINFAYKQKQFQHLPLQSPYHTNTKILKGIAQKQLNIFILKMKTTN